MNKLMLSKEIYSLPLINHAIYDFLELAEITVNCVDEYYILDFYNCKASVSITHREFENYLICMTFKEKEW